MLRVVMTAAACTVIRCGTGFVGPDSLTPDSFAGAWRSVTPSFLFVRLSFSSGSSETCGVSARITFSGTAWEGTGRITGDSLVLRMSNAGSAVPAGTIAVRPSGARALQVQLRPQSGAATDLTFVPD